MSVLVSTGLGLPAEDWDRVGHLLSTLLPERATDGRCGPDRGNEQRTGRPCAMGACFPWYRSTG